MSSRPAYEHNGRAISRERFYAIACDPARSVAVEACAGAGKTWMLVSRMVRALLAGARPQQILAITFTKKAAGEMRQRLHQWLADWSQASPETLANELRMRGVDAPPADMVQALGELYATLLASGRPVQVRTFHSWFAALLRNAPLAVLGQLGLPSRYELLEDDAEAVARVWRRFYTAVAREPQARIDYEAAVAAHGRSQTQKGLEAALAKRVEFALADEHGVVEASIRPFGEVFPQYGGLDLPERALEGDVARARWLARARSLGAEKTKTPQAAAAAVIDALGCDDLAERLALLRKAFFVAAEDRLSHHLAKFAAAQEAEAELQAICAARAQHEAWLHHHRMARLARMLLAEFATLKREQGWVDMNDVERAALVMLGDPVLSGWVQERLDQRVRHLLIDEFQDTNPLQWQALSGWLSSYAGAGGDAPSVFIVGDPKQSIYRFRRAEPLVFRAAQAFVVDALHGEQLSCDHTHRNAPSLLAVVNAVMADAQARGEYDGFRPHTTESVAAGQVAALPQWPREPRASGPAAAPAPAWRDSLTLPRELPEEKLVTLECRQAAAWIAGQLAAGLAPGDVMVLARRRDRLAALENELRALHIPAQQPEKTDLSEAPEVQDLVALLDVLVSPGHDLSLARVLKSPLFRCADEALVEIAWRSRERQREGRPLSWFELLRHEEGLPQPLREIGETLARWQALSNRLPPHDALQQIYEEGDVLARFARIAPPPLRDTVLANLRALLGAALAIDGGRYLTPYAMVRALKAGGIAGPAVAAKGVVRLLTVHGAKGLEAPVVLLLDCDPAPVRADTMGVLCEWPGESPAPWRFAFIASETRPPACSADALAVEQAARLREELNALYVAMTRAQNRLVLSSVQPASANAGSWWQRLLPHCELLPAPEAPPADGLPAPAVEQPFDLLVVPPLAPHLRAVAAAPSVAEPPASAQSRFGEAMHWLLEHWPRSGEPGPARMRRAARQFGLDEAAATGALAMARRILQGEGAWAWDAGTIDWEGNEVELHHQGELLRLDRLVRRRAGGEWWVLDYKSAGQPQQDANLIEQLGRYRSAVQAAYPGAAVRAAFLTGQGRLVTLP
jgi:ATP-dependent helicase/nuclease subunit A